MWMDFSSKSFKFNISDMGTYYEWWMGFNDTGNILTKGSIIHWVKEHNFEEWEKLKEENIDNMMVEIVNNKCGQWDIARLVYAYYKDKYRCTNADSQLWYEFKNHKWLLINKGASLRYKISERIACDFADKASELIIKATSVADDVDDHAKYKKQGQAYTRIGLDLRKTKFKTDVMKECAVEFSLKFPDFQDKLDENRNLMCFNNGVYDFEANEFRDGKPEDCITMCTGINYVPFDSNNEEHKKAVAEIKEFMTQLFPTKELRTYMWEHLASVLIGGNKNQTFNIYNGKGRNGKSKLVELMSLILGSYKGQVPISLVTQNRGRIGAASPEIAKLKGVRYAVMQEPTKHDKLNDGMMKELTGEDPITGRSLFKEPITYIPQFKLVVPTNCLFDIATNDDGTWRRIRLVEFISIFVKDPNPDNDYEYIMNQELSKKFVNWKEMFMDMLIKRVVVNNGIVQDCPIIMKASKKYRRGQDYLQEFVADKIIKGDASDRIIKTNVYESFKLWYSENYGNSLPRGKELYEYLENKLGRYRNGWKGYRIKMEYDGAESDDESDEESDEEE